MGMCGFEVLFALMFFRAPRSFLRYFLDFPEATKIMIESLNNDSVMHKCGN